jgi:alpha-galactosidase
MKELAEGMRQIGVRPGIWFRPLLNRDSSISDSMRLNRNQEYLDPSCYEVLELIYEDIKRISSWGFRLIKHDFTTYDVLGRWGFEMNPFPACGRWTFHDRSKTSAEIITGLYRTILKAAGTSLILGCNTIGHLGAGLMHIARTGDDTSGKNWERTRKMGINTLGFRLPQHDAFFAVDADCVGITEHIPWELNRQWAELLAYSGTAFFASVKPGRLKPDEFRIMKHLFQVASQQNSSAEPLDWMTNTVPDHWLLNGDKKRFDWIEKDGATPEFISEHM